MSAVQIPRVLVAYADFRHIGLRYSRRHINYLMKHDRFPKPIRLGGDDISTKAHWRLQDVLDWIEQRAEASGLPRAHPAGSLQARAGVIDADATVVEARL